MTIRTKTADPKPASDSGSPPKQTGHPQTVREVSSQGAKRAKNAVLNLTRWGILALILVFLLSSILALYEALNFQERVLQLASNDRDRASRVLGVLYDTLENPDAYPEDRELPYASIAVRLDRLSRVQAELAAFNLPDLPEEDAPADEETAEPGTDLISKNQSAEEPTIESAKEGAPASDSEGAPGGLIAGRNVDGPNQPTVPNGTINGHHAEPAAPPAEKAELENGDLPADHPKTLLKSTSQRLARSIADLDDTLKTTDPERRLVEELEKARRQIETLRTFSGTIVLARNDDSSSPFPSAHASEGLTLKQDRFQLQKLATDLGESFTEVERRVKTSPDDELLVAQLRLLDQAIEKLELFYDSDDLKRAEKKANEAESNASKHKEPSLDELVENIDHGISDVQSVLMEIDGGFIAATKLAKLINEARHVADKIKELPTDGVTHEAPKEDQPVDGTAALAAFDAARGDLAEAIQELEDQLGRRTRVNEVADQLAELEEEGDQGRFSRAHAILRAFDSVGRFEGTLKPLSGFAETPVLQLASGIGFDPQRIATLSHETLALIFVFVIGAIGSVIYITKDSIQLTLEGNFLTDPPKRSLTWHLFRPIFGVIVALAAFLLFKAGQLALGSSAEADGGQAFNLPVLSVIALFAGLLSWQALEAIETRGAVWFRSQKRTPLWASGLERKLQNEERTRDELASSIGRSVDQVFRWLTFRDRVTPEMQDRIADWLEVPYNQLFRGEQPKRKQLWLRIGHDDRDALEREVFSETLKEPAFPEDEVSKWLDERGPSPVPPRHHDGILLAMDRPMSAVFTDEQPRRKGQ